MGYSATAELQDFFDRAPAERACRRITERCVSDLRSGVRRRTPIAHPPVVDMAAQRFAGARGRTPGTLRASWRESDVAEEESPRGDRRFAGEAYTEDPVAPHVEYPTRPHLIRPRLDRAEASVLSSGGPRKMGTDPAARLRFVAGGRVVYAREVHHPGTQGAHMMRDALAELDGTWVTRVGEEEVDRWAREALSGVR